TPPPPPAPAHYISPCGIRDRGLALKRCWRHRAPAPPSKSSAPAAASAAGPHFSSFSLLVAESASAAAPTFRSLRGSRARPAGPSSFRPPRSRSQRRPSQHCGLLVQLKAQSGVRAQPFCNLDRHARAAGRIEQPRRVGHERREKVLHHRLVLL